MRSQLPQQQVFAMKIVNYFNYPIRKNQVRKVASKTSRQAEELFRTYMKEQGLRCTTERLQVLREVYRSNTHLDADELFVRLKKKRVEISRATVYHTLDLLFRYHLVTKIDLGHKHAHYEKAYGVANHLHIVCQECGRVVEVTSHELDGMMEKLCFDNGFSLGRFSLQVFGECRNEAECCSKNCNPPA
jgi:Fur family ferric uptake transcriptional regulator